MNLKTGSHIFLATFLLAVFLSIGYANAVESTVCLSGCDSSSVQDAIAYSNSYDTVKITEIPTAGINTSGLVVYYTFDDTVYNLTNRAGLLSSDSIGIDGNMTNEGNVRKIAGKLGKAYSYPAPPSTPGSSNDNGGTNINRTKWEFLHYQPGGVIQYSVNFWVNLTGYAPFTTTRAPVISTSRTAFAEKGMEVVFEGGNRRIIARAIGSTYVYQLFGPNDGVPLDNQFHMVTVVIDSTDSNSSDRARLYIDNQKKSAASVNTGSMSSGNPTRNPTVATSAESTYLNGSLDELSIWNRPLSDAEISALWNAGSGAVIGNTSTYDESVTVNVTGLTLTSNTTNKPLVWSGGTSSTVSITTNNVTVENIGVKYNGSTTNGRAFSLSSVSNVSIQNNNVITDGTSTGHQGIYLTSSISSFIYNNTISTNGTQYDHGIYAVSGSHENIFSNNNILVGGTGNGKHGIWIHSGNNATVSMNQITMETTSNSNTGIYFFTSVGSVADRNNVTLPMTDTIRGIDGIEIAQSSSGNTVSNNNISITGDGSNRGIHILQSTFNHVLNNNIISSGDNDGNIGIKMQITSNNNVIDRNNITTFGLIDSYGIHLSASDNNLFRSNKVSSYGTSTGNHGVRIRDSGNNTFMEGQINSTNGNDISLRDGTTSDMNYFINVSFDKNDISSNAISDPIRAFVQYRLDVFVANSSGPINGLNVFSTDSTLSPDADNPSLFSVFTNSSGYIPQQIVSSFVANGSYQLGNYLYFNNYTISTSSDFIDESVEINITQDTILSFTLNRIVNLFGRDGEFFELGVDDENNNVYAFVNSQNASSSLSTGWNHVVMTYDSGTISLYVNGQLAATRSVSAPSSSTRTVIVGNQTTLNLDEIKFYSRALSASEVANRFSFGNTLKVILKAVGQGSFGRQVEASVTTDDGSFNQNVVLDDNLVAGGIQSMRIENITGTTIDLLRATSNSCNKQADANNNPNNENANQLNGVYC